MMVYKRIARAILWTSFSALAVACADDIPTAATSSSLTHLSGTAALSAGSTRHLVHFNSDAVPADFADRVAALGATLDAAYDGVGVAVVDGLSADAVAALADDSDIATVDRDEVFQFIEDPTNSATDATDVVVASPQNPTTAFFYPRQWHMRAIGADAAWAAGQLGSPSVKVAIIDTGIDYLYPDLAGRVDLEHSVSFVPSDDALVATLFPTRHPVTDLHFHGTHVAATVSSNGLVAAGVTSATTLMGVKVIGRNGAGTTSATLAGIVYAVDNGADVLNLSLGIPQLLNRKDTLDVKGFQHAVDRAFQYAHKKGVLVVVAAGNEVLNLDTPHTFKGYCGSKHVTCVSATGPTAAAGVNGPWVNVDAFAGYSNFGVRQVNVSAPGGNTGGPVWAGCSTSSLVIPACRTGIALLGLNGTSQATPHVSGLAALLIAKHGHLEPGQLQAMIENSADDLGPKGKDPFYGQGRINVRKALGL